MKKALWSMAIAALGMLLANGADSAATEPVNDVKLTLRAAAAAPAGATGTADFRNLARKRPGPATLRVEIENLRPGNYELLAGRKSSGGFDLVGSVIIPDPAAIPAGAGGPSSHEDSTTHQAEVLHTRVEAELPLDVPPGDIDRIVLSDGGGNTLLEEQLPER
jgi:hypothetical protein